MKLTLDDGRVVEGTREEIETILRYGISNVDEWHWSTGRGEWVKIKNMHPVYAKNVLLQIYRDWVANLSKIADMDEVVAAIAEGPATRKVFNLLTKMKEAY